jgi:hypothetical protein
MSETKAEPKMLTTSDVAKRLKVDAKYLRAVLRSIKFKKSGGRYEWKENDLFLRKIPRLIKRHASKPGAKKTGGER